MNRLARKLVLFLAVLLTFIFIHHSTAQAAPLYCAQSLPFGDLGQSIDMVRGATGRPVWITEIGVGRSDSQWQADYLERVFNVIIEKGVPVIIWYGWKDTMLGADGGGYGLYTASNTIKLSGLEFTDYTFEKPARLTQDTGRRLTGVSAGLPGDINGDGVVDKKDYDILVSQFGQKGQNLSADLDRDGDVDIFDHKILAENYGRGAP